MKNPMNRKKVKISWMDNGVEHSSIERADGADSFVKVLREMGKSGINVKPIGKQGKKKE